MSGNETVEVAGELIVENSESYQFFDGTITTWLPKSQVEWNPDTKEMTMPEWLAMDRGLI